MTYCWRTCFNAQSEPFCLGFSKLSTFEEAVYGVKFPALRGSPTVSGRFVAHPMEALYHQSRQEAHGHLSHSCGHTRGHYRLGSRLFTVSASILRAMRSLMVPIMLAGIVTSVWNRKPRLIVRRRIFPEA
jgi:hypothetical protein